MLVIEEVPMNQTDKYGIIAGNLIDGRKPASDDALSSTKEIIGH